MDRLKRSRWLVAAVTAGAMVATPFAATGGRARRLLTPATVVGLAATTMGSSAARWGGRRAAVAVVATTTVTHAVERLGVRTAFPFGRYAYRPTLQPQIGGVPAVVPLAWLAMAVPAREVAHAALAGNSTPARRIVGGAFALTAWDLFLDPQMTHEGYWAWSGRGRYRGIPATNFLGWLVTGIVVMTFLEVALPAGDTSAALVAQYAAVGGMESAAFATFFDDRLVATVGSAAMLPLAAVALLRVRAASGGVR
ncbi:MAG TPA: carotenoid biosynthesis protein [Ilumatobacter sp.]|nr:carotenoid biosynthesis protein [Ilumatobacter sp.]